MMQLSMPKIEEEILASSLRRQQDQLKELLDAIERRDANPQDVQSHLDWAVKNLARIRKSIRT